MIKKDIIGVLILLMLAAIVAFSYNHFSSNGISYFGQWEKSNGVITAKAKNDIINPSIEIKDLNLVKQIVKNKDRLILDVRSKDTYNKGHLPGALSFPLIDFDDVIDSLFDIVKPDSAILVYCSSSECTDAHTFATLLLDFGFSNIKIYSQGFQQWQEKGLKIEQND